jgi:hypothetical protein
MPDQDTVVAINSGVRDTQAVLNTIWDKLLPNLQAQALPPNPEAVQKLDDTLARFEVRVQEGAATSAIAARVFNRKFVFPANDEKIESVELTEVDAGKAMTLSLRMAGKEVTIPCGYREWRKSRAPFLAGKLAQFPDEPEAGTFAWPGDNPCAIKLCAIETPYHRMLTFKFDGDRVTFDSELNVSFEATKQPSLTGKAE